MVGGSGALLMTVVASVKRRGKLLHAVRISRERKFMWIFFSHISTLASLCTEIKSLYNSYSICDFWKKSRFFFFQRRWYLFLLRKAYVIVRKKKGTTSDHQRSGGSMSAVPNDINIFFGPISKTFPRDGCILEKYSGSTCTHILGILSSNDEIQ